MESVKKSFVGLKERFIYLTKVSKTISICLAEKEPKNAYLWNKSPWEKLGILFNWAIVSEIIWTNSRIWVTSLAAFLLKFKPNLDWKHQTLTLPATSSLLEQSPLWQQISCLGTLPPWECIYFGILGSGWLYPLGDLRRSVFLRTKAFQPFFGSCADRVISLCFNALKKKSDSPLLNFFGWGGLDFCGALDKPIITFCCFFPWWHVFHNVQKPCFAFQISLKTCETPKKDIKDLTDKILRSFFWQHRHPRNVPKSS